MADPVTADLGYGAPGSGGSQGPSSPHGPPSGATGIAAAILAVVLALVAMISVVLVFNSPVALDWDKGGPLIARPDGSFTRADQPFHPISIAYMAAFVIVGAVLLVGSILLFLRSTAGRVVVIVGAVLSAIIGAVGFAPIIEGGGYSMNFASIPLINGEILGAIQPLLAVALLALVLAPSTGRWIRAARPPQPRYPQGGYRPY